MPDETRIAATMGALDGASGSADGSVDGPASALFVPGRIEVVGKHTDYAGGRSLLTATDQGLCVCFRPRRDALLRVTDATRGLEAELLISPRMPPTTGWSNYLVTVGRRLASNFSDELQGELEGERPGGPASGLRGADVAFTSDLPLAAGMSSSSALVVATYLVLAEVNRLAERPVYREAISTLEQLGEYLGCVENGLDFGPLAGEAGVGTAGGSEDQIAILCSEKDELRQYSYTPVRHESTILLPPGLELAIAVCGVSAEKAGSARRAYNRASRLAAGIAEAWRRATGRTEPHAAAILALGGEARRRLEAILAEGGTAESRTGESSTGEFSGAELARRLAHFATESEEIVPRAGAALAAGDLEAFGELVDRSQRCAEELLDNQIPETIQLARSARELGAHAASAFGAGFGGSVWALVERRRTERFLAEWSDRYLSAFPGRTRARFLATGAAPGARRLDDRVAAG